MSGGVDYFTHCSNNGTHDLYLNDDEHAEEGYLTDLLSHRAVDYVQRMAASGQDDQPFFLSLHYTAPHWPWETREDGDIAQSVKSNLFHLDGGNIHTYHRMIHHMDEGIGWLLDALRDTKQLDNTLIVFTSDNGGERFSDNWPLVGGKMDLTEGGIRVPWIAHWPAVISAGAVSSQHCLTMDWSATMLDLGGATIPDSHPLDGISLRPVLQDPTHLIDRPLFWRMNHRQQRAMRSACWKYLRVDGNDFFCGLTFPVGDDHCSLILGGWGGGVVGLSSINGEDAANNATTKIMSFDNNRWYAVRIRVTAERIECFLDDEQVIDQVLADIVLSVRQEVIPSQPLGIATYCTTAEIRGIRWRPVPGPKARPPAP